MSVADLTRMATDWAAFFVAFAATLVAFAGVTKAFASTGLGKPARWIWRRLVSEPVTEAGERTLNRVLDARLKPILDAQQEIRREVTPNGGGSIKDAVRRLEEGQARLAEAVAA